MQPLPRLWRGTHLWWTAMSSGLAAKPQPLTQPNTNPKNNRCSPYQVRGGRAPLMDGHEQRAGC